jgi:hypothetical protein
MTNMKFRAVVALLATFTLVGCGALPQLGEQQQQAQQTQVDGGSTVVAPQGTVTKTAKPAVSKEQQVVGNFPTSAKPAQGKPWSTMHAQGFTGSYAEASKLLGLSPAQAKKYEEMHSADACQVMEVPNGVVLDRLTFTRDGKHHIDYGAKVALVNPSSRKTEVCDLGGGVMAMRFHGCNNHAVVVGWKPGKATAAPASVPATACPNPVMVRVNVWNSRVVEFPGAQEAVALAKTSSESYFNPKDLSRGIGDKLLLAGKQGSISRSTVAHEMTVTVMKANGTQEVVVPKRGIVGEYTFPMPATFGNGDVMRVVFTDLSKFHSPVSDLRAAWSEFQKAICGHRNNFHAIEK